MRPPPSLTLTIVPFPRLRYSPNVAPKPSATHPPNGGFSPQEPVPELTVTFDETVQGLLGPTDLAVLGLENSGVCFFANLAASALLGLKAGEALGRDLSGVLETRRPRAQPGRDGRSVATPVLIHHPDGPRRTVAVATSVRRGGLPYGVLLTFAGERRDWTPTGGHGASSAFLERLLDSVDEYVVVQAPDGACMYANQRVTEICGIPREQLIGKDLVGVFGLDGKAHSVLLEAMLGRRSASGECVLARTDGSERLVTFDYGPLVVAGRTVAMVAVGEDVTDRRRDEARLRELDTMLSLARSVAMEILSSASGLEALRDIAGAVGKLARADGAAILVHTVRDGEGPTVVLAPRERDREWTSLIENLARLRGAAWPERETVDEHQLASFHVVRQGEIVATLVAARALGAQPFSAEDRSAVESITAHVAVAIHHMRLMARQRELLQRVIEAQESERMALSRDLHDGLAQYVMALHAYLQSAQHAVEESDQPAANRRLADAGRTAATAVQEVRRLVGGLRLLTLEDLGLSGALEQLLDEERRRAGWLAAEFRDETGGFERLSQTVETAAYRVAQEALSNARKHAGAQRVELRLRRLPNEDAFELVVADDGCGFIPSARSASPQHLGIHGMQERALLVRGQLRLESAPGRGTTVRATFPLTGEGTTKT